MTVHDADPLQTPVFVPAVTPIPAALRVTEPALGLAPDPEPEVELAESVEPAEPAVATPASVEPAPRKAVVHRRIVRESEINLSWRQVVALPVIFGLFVVMPIAVVMAFFSAPDVIMQGPTPTAYAGPVAPAGDPTMSGWLTGDGRDLRVERVVTSDGTEYRRSNSAQPGAAGTLTSPTGETYAPVNDGTGTRG